jgi:hypothetical protein
MIFIPAKLSPLETGLFSYVLEDINMYNKYRCIVARLGRYKRIEVSISVAR